MNKETEMNKIDRLQRWHKKKLNASKSIPIGFYFCCFSVFDIVQKRNSTFVLSFFFSFCWVFFCFSLAPRLIKCKPKIISRIMNKKIGKKIMVHKRQNYKKKRFFYFFQLPNKIIDRTMQAQILSIDL